MHSLRRHYRLVLVLALLAVLIHTGIAPAVNQENQELHLKYDEPQAQPTTSMGGLLLRLVLSLVFIIAVAWIAIRAFGKQVTGKTRGEWIQVLDEVALGPSRGIVLCEVGGKVYAVGVTDHQITALFQVTDETVVGDMLAKKFRDSGNPPGGLAVFWQNLRDSIPVRKGQQPRRRFHALMSEQVQRLQQMSLHQADAGASAERSGDDEQEI